ncbi:zinc finger protein Dzip1 isoform X4 [Pygocentrus nattereri]|uniref:zinc finger protein Dzip1 isoform X4 n=1 Tax=Pygocentrus nattereri TaxID=42514 RepID=UPI001890C2F1|nr:zinc finger protein Dzip1 isoform X4 [Pygocentrus nattereri]
MVRREHRHRTSGPFYNNVYYPFPSEPLGAHSSAGIPSLLNSPQSQLSSGSQSRPTGSAMSRVLSCGAAAVAAPFKFRARRESVDWRRINAIDVERVACELDFQTLQDHITAVTFCNVEGERCPRCQSQVDPALLKLFRLAQLTVEYLLHSQDCLTVSLQAAEERLQAEAQEREQLKAQLQKQIQDAKSLKEELKQRKKIIASQQAMITAGIANYHKCQHCEKAFMNASFLQSHMQRRHPMDYDIKLMTDNQKKVHTVKLQEEINKLQEQLTLARLQMETQQKDYSAKQEKDLNQKQEEFMKQLDMWKEDERVRMNSKIDEVKQACQREMDSLHQRNRNLEKEVLKLQQSSKMQDSTQTIQAQTSSLQNTENKHLQEVIQLQQKLHKQEVKWAAKMQKMKEEYESEKSQLQATLADGQEMAQRQRQKLELMLQEQQKIITSKDKQMKQVNSNPPTLVLQQEVVVPSAPELKPKVVVSVEQSSSVYKLDPIVELSEEDKDSSSISESLPDTQSLQQKADELLKKPGLKKDMRMAVQQSLHDKLFSLGIQPGANQLSKTTYKSAVAQMVSERQQRQEEVPEYQKVQKEVSRKLEQRLKEKNTEPSSKPKQSVQVAESRPRSSSLPTTVTRVISGPPARPQHTPQPAHRNKTSTLPKTSTPVLHQKTPPFSSDETSSEEEESEEESPQAQKTSQSKGPQVNTATMKTQPPRAQPRIALQVGSSSQALALRSAALQPSAQRSGAHQAPVVSVNRTEVTVVESESEWTEGSEMEEITLDQLQTHTDQNGNVQKASHSNVKVLTKNLEQQLAERGLKKPAGGINTVHGKPTEVTITNDVVRDLKYTELDDDDDDDWDISSLEDVPATHKPDPAVVKKSTDKSVDTSTSVWGTSTGKGQKPGLNDAGTGSTLKSSIVTVSDWDDSDDI